MDKKQKLEEKLGSLSNKIKKIFDLYTGENIPEKKLKKAIEKYAHGVKPETVIGLYDETLLNNGKSGIIFTKDFMCIKQMLEKSKKIWYEDINSMKIIEGKKEEDTKLIISFDDQEISITNSTINIRPLKEFLNYAKDESNISYKYNRYLKNKPSSNHYSAMAGGFTKGNYSQVNKGFSEENMNARQGHGFAAEHTNTLYDKISGKEAKIVGADNAKNGADRIVNGTFIQTKYCNSARNSINSCFENGKFRYFNTDGSPMQIEVPSDQYDDAVRVMKEKISNGNIPGVSDPNEAKNIVRKGHFSYLQAKNIAKAGTVESIIYDSVNGVIISTSVFGITATITFAQSLWNGNDFDVALKSAAYEGLKIGGTAFITTVLVGQLSKAGLNSALVNSSESIVNILGPKVSAKIINAFRTGADIHGAAAMKSAAKLLRNNTITSVVTIAVLTSYDVVSLFRSRISGKQLFKNLTNTTSTVFSATGAFIQGTAFGGPVVGFIASAVVGGIAGSTTNKIMTNFIEDDAVKLVSILEDTFVSLVDEYLLTEKEVDKVIDKLQSKLTKEALSDMYASSDKISFSRKLLIPIIENEIAKRKNIKEIPPEYMTQTLASIFDEIIDDDVDELNLVMQ